MYNTFTVVSTQNVRTYFVSGHQEKLRLIKLAAETCYLKFCRATVWPARRRWHTGTPVVVSRNHFHPMDFITFIQSFCWGLYLDTCHFSKCLFDAILHLYGIRSLCISFHSFPPLILTGVKPWNDIHKDLIPYTWLLIYFYLSMIRIIWSYHMCTVVDRDVRFPMNNN